MNTNKKQQTRREILKTTALGAGLLILDQTVCQAQFGRGRGGGGGGGGRGGLPLPISRENPSIQHNVQACKSCGHCREFCQNATTVFGRAVPAGEDACINCGQCTLFCRRNAINERYHYPLVSRVIADQTKIVVASTSPAIRVALGEMFNMTPGTNVEGKIVGALKSLGVNHVLDTTFSADLTVMEEASELLQRLETQQPMPMFTSCCPAWVRFAKLFYPGLLSRISSTKSPVLMQGALVKTYFAQKLGINPQRIFHVALTPCTAKKAEILLPGMNAAGIRHGNPEMRDVDAVLTTRELGYLLGGAKIDLAKQSEKQYDQLMGVGSGAGMIFGNTGGVTEAAMRTAFWMLNGEAPPKEFYQLQSVRGSQSVREATVDLGKTKLNIALVHGVGQSRALLDAIVKGETKYHFVEVMACPGGCIGGGGQPRPPQSRMPQGRNQQSEASRVAQQRASALWRHDITVTKRLSYENPQIQAVYDDFLGKPLGETAEELLHVAKR